MLSEEIFTIFEKIEREYKKDEIDTEWNNYFSQIDWDIKENKIKTFVKSTQKDVIEGNLDRCMSHELRDNTIIEALTKINVKTILDIGADTGMFLAKCKYNGIDGIGIEPVKKTVDYVNKKNYVKLFCFDLQALMQKFENKGYFEACSMLNFFHGAWKDISQKGEFTKYLANEFKYAVLSDNYKNNKPDPILTKYFELVYDFNMFGLVSLRQDYYKISIFPSTKLNKFLNKFFRTQENQIYKKMHHLCVHKLYMSKKYN